MHFRLFAIAGVTGLLLFAPAVADASCCDQAKPAGHEMKAGCCDMPCCKDQAPAQAKAEPTAIDYLIAAGFTPVTAPARQETMVWFKRPVLVGRSILQGQYIIQHDNDRMARGEPCTHIYAFNDRTKPVVAFHCTHLERAVAKTPVAVLETKGDWQVLTEFQFSGETASHGVPATIR